MMSNKMPLTAISTGYGVTVFVRSALVRPPFVVGGLSVTCVHINATGEKKGVKIIRKHFLFYDKYII